MPSAPTRAKGDAQCEPSRYHLVSADALRRRPQRAPTRPGPVTGTPGDRYLRSKTFHGHGSRGSFRGPTRRFAPATGSLTSGIARTFLVRCPIFLRLLPSVYTIEPEDARSEKQEGAQCLAGSRCGCRCWCTAVLLDLSLRFNHYWRRPTHQAHIQCARESILP